MNKSLMRDNISQYFNTSELKNLCLDINVGYENLAGDTLIDKARELVAYCERHGQLNQLVEKCKSLRPHVNWPEPSPPEPSPPEPLSAETDSTIPFDWVTIQSGEFWMGSDRDQDPYARNFGNEKRHSLYLPQFRIAKVPVTVDQFRRFINSTQYKTTAEKMGWARDLEKGLERDDWPRKKGVYWEHPHGPDSNVQEDHPVTCISWKDAVEFCKWAGVRLPTEAEWEKAAGWDPENKVKHIYPWSDDPPDNSRCNFGMQVGDTTPVYRYPPGTNGLYDMAGNVWEWTSSLYKQYPYEADDRENLEAIGERILRGGSFYQKAQYVRCTYRNRHRPEARVSDYGFRVCAMKPGEY